MQGQRVEKRKKKGKKKEKRGGKNLEERNFGESRVIAKRQLMRMAKDKK